MLYSLSVLCWHPFTPPPPPTATQWIREFWNTVTIAGTPRGRGAGGLCAWPCDTCPIYPPYARLISNKWQSLIICDLALKYNYWREPKSRQSAKLFLQSSELGLSQPSPYLASECAPPRVWEEGHTREREVKRVPIPTRDIHCGALYIYVLCDGSWLPGPFLVHFKLSHTNWRKKFSTLRKFSVKYAVSHAPNMLYRQIHLSYFYPA